MTADMAELLEELERRVLRGASPWCCRKSAAAYCDCSADAIDDAADAGSIKRYWNGSDPRFKKCDLDKWLETNPQPKTRRGRKVLADCHRGKDLAA